MAFLCIALAGRGVVFAFAFDPDSISWRSIGRDQEFTGGAVSCIIQDKLGLVWIGTAGGLYRYDGHGFKVFKPDQGTNSLASSSISAVLEDRQGNFWVGSDGGGLVRYDALSGRSEKIRLAGDEREKGMASRISSLAMDASGRVFAGSVDGTVRLIDPEGGVSRPFVHPGENREPVTSMLVDSKDRIWVGTAGAGLYSFDLEGRPEASFRHDGNETGSIASDSVSAIIEDSLGFIWIGFSDGGIDLFGEGPFRHGRREGGAKGRLPAVFTLAEDIKGQIWAGFREGGVGILDPSSMETSIAPFDDGAEVRVLMRDRRGLMWAGLGQGGLLTGDFRSMAFSRFSSDRSGRALGPIHAIAEFPPGGMILAAQGAGLLSFDPASASFTAMKSRTPDFDFGKVRTALAASDGSLWLGSSDSGLLRRFPDGSVERYAYSEGRTESLASSSIACLLETGDGRLWVGTGAGGLDLLDPASGRALHWGGGEESSRLLPASIINCLARDSMGRVWAGSADAGLFVLDPGASRFRSVGQEERQSGGIGDLRIESILEDSHGTLWVGTGGGGLVGLDPDTGAVRRRGAAIGLFADTVYAMAEDKAGTLWILSSVGLFSLDPVRNDVFLFGKEDGLSGGGLEAGAVAISENGDLWVGSGEGMTRFNPTRIARYAPTPDVVISDIELFGEGSSVTRSPNGSEITLNHDNMGLGFSIAAIDYAAPGRNRYAMRLEGRQPAWTPMGNVNTGYIAPLAPGRYMLRVRAANGNGVWNDYGASLSILVRSPWWGTWWFRTLILGSAAVVLAAAIALRLRSLHLRNALLVKFARHIEEAREEERTIAARDVHDEIGQHLMVLNFKAYWLASHAEAGAEERLPVIKEMQGAILDAMASVKAVATRLRPLTADTLDFPDALRWYVRSFGRMSGIKTSLEIDEGWKDLPPEAAKAFFRLLQEMLSNVARHSRANSVSVCFSAGEEWFSLEVRDNGVGIDAEKVDAQDSFGIIGMREGCAALGGAIAIEGAPGHGCAVAARLPRTRKTVEKKWGKRRC